MTDTPTPPAMTPEQRAELVAELKRRGGHSGSADQLEADGVTIATLTAERDAARAEIARLTAAHATAREDGMREAARIVDEKYANGEMGNPGHHIHVTIQKGTAT